MTRVTRSYNGVPTAVGVDAVAEVVRLPDGPFLLIRRLDGAVLLFNVVAKDQEDFLREQPTKHETKPPPNEADIPF